MSTEKIRFINFINFLFHKINKKPNEKTINYYLQDLRPDLDEKLSIPQKTDYYRYALLYKYGGIWLDFDTIVMQDLKPLYDNLEKYDYIGSGCHSDHCKKTGYPFPSNWMMMSRAGTKFINTCNAMIHSRWMGETFGLAVAEFSYHSYLA